MIIRPERPEDINAIHRVTTQAFGRPQEADLIDALRANKHVTLSLVAIYHNEVVGHILFFPLEVKSEHGAHAAIGLGPMAVLPQYQKQGIGSALVSEGLNILQQRSHSGVIVLGHAAFYPRFGFVPASAYKIKTEYDVPDEVFMAYELHPGALAEISGTVIYSAEFDSV